MESIFAECLEQRAVEVLVVDNHNLHVLLVRQRSKLTHELGCNTALQRTVMDP